MTPNRHLLLLAGLTLSCVLPLAAQQSTKLTDAFTDLGRTPIAVTTNAGPETAVTSEEAEIKRLMALPANRIPIQQANLATAINVIGTAANVNMIAPAADDFPELVTISVNMNPWGLMLELADLYRFTPRFKNGLWTFSREAVGALVPRTYHLRHTNLDSFTAKQNTMTSLGGGESGGSGGGDSGSSGGSSGLSQGSGHVFEVDTKKIVEDVKELLGLPSTSVRSVVFTKGGEAMPVDEGRRPITVAGGKDSGAKVIYLPNTRDLYVVGTRSQISYVEEYLKQIDKVEKQVRIVARFVQTTRDPRQIIGIDPSKFQPNVSLSGMSTEVNLNKLSSLSMPSNAILSVSDLSLQLNALSSNSDSKLVNNPDVTTTNNREVYMSVGSEEPFLESNTTNLGTGLGSSQAKIAYRRIGTTVNVTPTIFDGEDGKESIRLFVQVEVAKLTGFRSINGVAIPVVASEKYLYTVFVPNGYTLAFGGFSGLEESSATNAVPGISKVPVVGWFFKSRDKRVSQKNLIAYITPTIIEAKDYTAAGQTPPPIPGELPELAKK